MRTGETAVTSMCPLENAAWCITPGFRRMVDGYWWLRWTVKARFCPAAWFHFRAGTTPELWALPMANASLQRGRRMANGSTSLRMLQTGTLDVWAVSAGSPRPALIYGGSVFRMG